MNIKETVAIINQMQADGVIGQYAIGGAVAATFYLEAADTQDVDIFVALKVVGGQSLVTLSPIYDYLTKRGCQIKEEYIVIAGWPVQFLPAERPLLKEALEKSITKDIDGIPVRVFAPEHLAAVALELGRAKDKLRLIQFLEARILNENDFSAILAQHKLLEKWAQFKKQMID